MTERLYENDSYAGRFEAEVVRSEAGSDCSRIVLDRTLFFPEEGGQSADRGTLNGLEVCDVQIHDGEIIHTVKGELPVGTKVTGVLDWDFRFRNMQMHSGEHIFSGLVYRQFGFSNVGFHLSENSATMDFNGKLTAEDIASIEKRANEIIVENHPIRAWYPSADELALLEYRSKKTLEGPVRLVAIEDIDLCACCVPHVRSTAEIGCFKIVASENYKGGVRLQYRCGFRAMEYFENCLSRLSEVGRLVSAKPEQIGSSVEKLLEDNRQLHFRLLQAERAAVADKLKEMARDGQKADKLLLFLSADAGLLRYAMDEAEQYFSGTVALFFGDEENGYRYILENRESDLAEMHNAFRAACGAKGGGSPRSVTGSVRCTEQEIRQFFKEYGF